MDIRILNKEDAKTVAELEKEVFSDPWSEKSVEGTLEQRNYINLGVCEGEKLLGYLLFSCILDEGEVIRIAVAPDARRRGVAKKMFQYLQELCVEKGIEKWLLDVRVGNESAIACYKYIGFEEDGFRKNFYSNPMEDAVLMSRRIG